MNLDLTAPLLLGVKWLDPSWLQHHYGSAFIWISLAIVFVECGLLFPFLPGDTLLFALGLFIAGSDKTGYSVLGIGNEPVELVLAMLMLMVAAFLGNLAGYEIGRRVGPSLFERDGRIIKRKYLDNTSAFFDKHGNLALVAGRFVPFVRTYVTVVAGITQMQRRRFLLWSGIGAVAWIVAVTLLGYFLGAAFPALGDNIDYVTLAILAFTAVPLVWEWFKHRHDHDAHHSETQDTDQDGESAPEPLTTPAPRPEQP